MHYDVLDSNIHGGIVSWGHYEFFGQQHSWVHYDVLASNIHGCVAMFLDCNIHRCLTMFWIATFMGEL